MLPSASRTRLTIALHDRASKACFEFRNLNGFPKILTEVLEMVDHPRFGLRALLRFLEEVRRREPLTHRGIAVATPKLESATLGSAKKH